MEPTCQSVELSMPIESAGSSSQTTNASQTEIRVELSKRCFDGVILVSKAQLDSKEFLSFEGKDIEMRVHPNPSHSDYVSYIKRDVLFPQIQPADSITVFVEIDVAVETITTSVDDSFGPCRSCTCERQLGEDYLKLLSDMVLTDFTIKVQDKEIHVHKAILAARSPVFSAMLQHVDTSESKTGILEIKDVEYNVVKEMLRLEELKNHCEQSLIQAINFDNACHLLIIADMYGASNLREKVLHFIKLHPKKIVHTAGWISIIKEHPQLATDIVASFDKS
uniref:BTB domain-containing protein n=1 Tax=Meloidogyne javanica TaxID=6303 RepID=A0A915LL81_MELJA